MVTLILITPVLVQLAVPSLIAYSMHFAPSMLHCILVNVNAPQLVSKIFIGENAQHKPHRKTQRIAMFLMCRFTYLIFI